VKKVDRTAILEGLKQGARIFLMGAVPLILVDLKGGEFNFQTWLLAGLVAVLAAVDKWLHKKETGVLGNGLTGF